LNKFFCVVWLIGLVYMEKKFFGEKTVKGTWKLKDGLARMLKGGCIMDVVNASQAKIAEKAGACAVMALERVPADIRAAGGVARMADPVKVKEIMNAVSIPVMAKCRIGHFVEAQILQELGVDFIDESEVLTPADQNFHIDKKKFEVPFVCGARNFGEALRRIHEGAAMIRTKGEAGTGNIIEAVRHVRTISNEISSLSFASKESLEEFSNRERVPFKLVYETVKLGRLPVVNFAAGGIATPADAALMMQLGCDGVFVGSGIFKSSKPEKMAKAIVQATTNFNDPKVLAKISAGLGNAMPGIEISKLDARLQERGV
jgi:pyridoxal 5'-phosphate synthase pdxS subunit